jgi:acetyl esterase/lipase
MMAKEYEVAIKPDIVFAEHDGVKLLGDLYLPQGLGEAPVLVGVHGGGWQLGDRKFYRHWGNYLAKHGYAVFAIEYRLMKPGVKTWPVVVGDCRAAVQFVRANAVEFGLGPNRIGLIGDSAGAHLSALVALAGEEPMFSNQYCDDPYAATPPGVKMVIGFYGVYDMVAQWEHDQITPPARFGHREITRLFANDQPQDILRGITAELCYSGQEQHALPFDLWPGRRHRRTCDTVGEIPDCTQAGRLLCAHDRGAGCGPFLECGPGRGARQLRRLRRPQGATVPCGTTLRCARDALRHI